VIKAIVYSDISYKKNLKDSRALSPEECLARTLDLIDFNAALSKNTKAKKERRQVDQFDWVELTFLKKW